jgi:outer membrane receptor protein involved in Fe transport
VAADAGTLSGRVFDAATGEPIEGATVVLDFPEPEDGSIPPQLVALSGPAGDYEFDESIAPGVYGLSFVKSGYRPAVVPDLRIGPGEEKVVDFPMDRALASTPGGGEVLDLEAYEVSIAQVGEMMNNLELRLESDKMMNLLSAEDLSRFAASDVADALKRVAGVNVVEGQFAIIRGLEDRYSSTLYNGAPIPSPDPERQSVQLDLFPSEVVTNIEIDKTFLARSPSNSAGGGINIVTHDYPEEWTFKLSLGTGFEERALDQFIRYDRLSPVGVNEGPSHVIESDVSAMLGGRKEWWNREFRFKFVASNEIDFKTQNGFQFRQEPIRPRNVVRDGVVVATLTSGGLSKGVLDRPGAKFELDQSTRQDSLRIHLGAGMDLDEAGHHRVDGSFFHIEAADETVQNRDNGFVPGFDYSQLLAASDPLPNTYERFVAKTWLFDWRPDDRDLSDGRQAFYAPVYERRTFDRERTLDVYQLNGVHELDQWVEGLELGWIANYSESSQDETTYVARFFFDAEDPLFRPATIPNQPSDYPGGGLFGTRDDLVFGSNDIEENQYFARLTLDYEFDVAQDLAAELRGGFWFEQANREVKSDFVVTTTGDPTQPGVRTFSGGPSTDYSVTGANPLEMGRRVFRGAQLDDDRPEQTSDTKREITAYDAEVKLTAFEDVDVIAGVRIENLRIETQNDPFTGFCGNQPVNPDGTCPQNDPRVVEDIYPSRFLYIDRLDNPDPDVDGVSAPPGTIFNDEIIGFKVPIDPETGYVDCRTRDCIDPQLRGEINDTFFLPAISAAYRPFEGWALRFGYSQTVARPSFRELGYYTSIESGSDEFIVGNPQLTTSDVESIDGRVEWTWGDFGDLLAASVFYKTIDDPIESILLRDPSNADCTGVCQYRTFLNTPSEAELIGMELEGRRTFDFVEPYVGMPFFRGFFEAISIGGNFTYIDAEVQRNDATLARFSQYFGITDADRAAGLEAFTGYKSKRRLFGQPEWIANADFSFDHEEWGTKLTLSVFAISEVLDAVGSVELGNNGIENVTLDRYLDKFYQLDLVASQDFELPRVPGLFTFRVSVKNLTDSTRKVIYDQEQTINDYAERSIKIGRDYSFSVGYVITY